MRIPYIPTGDSEAIFAGLPEQAVACCNWPEAYPAQPKVSFKIYHDGDNLHICYRVDEPCTAAATTDDNGPVWLDSCTEFFIAPDDGGYYNFELNCVGALLIGYRNIGEKTEHADAATLASVKRQMSFPRQPLAPHAAAPWTSTLVIPAKALFRHKLDSWSKLRARVNFYKCGDNLPEPHYLSWAPIEWSKPNFHLPQFFDEADFD